MNSEIYTMDDLPSEVRLWLSVSETQVELTDREFDDLVEEVRGSQDLRMAVESAIKRFVTRHERTS